MIIAAIDLGASFAKAILCKSGKIDSMTSWESSQTRGITNVTDWLKRISPTIPDIIVVTGGRSKFFPKEIGFDDINIPVTVVPEMEAIGRSAGTEGPRLVVSIGTGTAIVKWDDGYVRLGGTGVGGGLVYGLGRLLSSARSFEELEELAMKGTRKGADLTVGDILGTGLGPLSKKVTAANFGRAAFTDIKETDLARACFTLAAETTIVLSSQIAKSSQIAEIWFTGKLITSRVFQRALSEAADELHFDYHVHAHPEYATAMGALHSVR